MKSLPDKNASQDAQRWIYENVIASSVDGIVAFDRDCRYLVWNPSMERMTGLSQEEVLSKAAFELFPHLKGTDEEKCYFDALSGRNSISKNRAYTATRGGGQGFYDAFYSPLLDGNQAIIGGSIVVREITERKNSEDALRGKNQQIQLLQTVTRAANELGSEQEAVQRTLVEVCLYTGWSIGHVFSHIHGFPESAPIWHLRRSGQFDEFQKTTMQSKPDGVIEKAFLTGKPVWIPDLSREPMFSRATIAERVGLKSGVAFPVLIGTEVVAVLEFFSASPLLPDAGLETLMLNVGTQLGRVVERKRNERASRSNEERLRLIIDMAYDAFVALDRQGKVIEWNPQAVLLFGWTKEEAMGKEARDLFLPISAGEVREEGLLALARGRGLQSRLEITVVNKNGREFPVDATLTPMGTGDQEWVSVIFRDFSETKTEGGQLQLQLESKYHDFFEAVPNLVWTAEPVTGRFDYLNTRWFEFSGWATLPDENWDWKAIVHGDEVERVQTAWQRSLQTGRELDLECRLKSKDGSYHWFLNRALPLRDNDGTISKWIGTSTDIDDQKRAEAAVRKSEDRLKRQAQDLARSNADLEQFAYVASHDLKEPLRMVSNYIQLLKMRYQTKLDPDADLFIGYAVEGVMRMYSLINDLLSYSRIEIRGHTFDLIDSAQACETAIANLQAAINETSTTLECGELPKVRADRTQMIQLFQNLIANAIKFRGEKPPRVKIDCTRKGPDWQFAVTDNGIGIDPKYAGRIFVIFQRLHGRDKYGGTGIGLAICRKIVLRFGGHIWVESKPGVGSIFFFTIPAEAAAKA